MITYLYQRFFSPFVLCSVVFLVYFSSAAGLYNSIDTPQFFTTEAVISHRSLNLQPFLTHQQFQVYPDVYYVNGEIRGFRGYGVSLISIPLHIIAKYIHPNYSLSNFDMAVQRIQDMQYTVAITSLFPVFSVVGLLFFWKTITEISTKHTATWMTIFLAFGTYIWKYSSTYIRQGPMVAIIGIYLYALYQVITKKNQSWFIILFFLQGFAFSIDTILFFSLFPISIILLLTFMKNKLLSFRFGIYLRCGAIFITILACVNLYAYNTLFSSQLSQQETLKTYFGSETTVFLTKSPLLPSLACVLFCNDRIPSVVFGPLSKFPKKIQESQLYEYAKTHRFYGIFSITPILFVGIGSFKLKYKKEILVFLLLCIYHGLIGLILNAKFIGFWGSTQYDVRYFYPYTLFLAVPAALVVYNISKIQEKILKILAQLVVWSLGIYSLFMGWIGVLNMFQPIVTGERRIWIEPHYAVQLLKQTDPELLFKYTFYNFPNLWIGIFIISIVGFIFTVYKFFIPRFSSSVG